MKVKNNLNESVVKLLLPVLEKYNFHKKGLNYYYNKNSNWGLISFQKSINQMPEVIRFTINLGVASNRLLRFFSFPLVNKKPNIEDCHWRIRLGELSHGEDIWWSIENETPNKDLDDYLLYSIENLAIPEIYKYMDDIALRDLWLSGHAPSLTEFQRLLYLSILLKEIGPKDLLSTTLIDLKQISEGKPTSYTAEVYVRKILEQK